MDVVIRVAFYLFTVLILAIFLSKYLYKIFKGEKLLFTRFISPIENAIYKILKIKVDDEMDSKKYFFSVVSFSFVCFVFLFLILLFQQYLPLNEKDVKGMDAFLAFHTSISYVTNTNFQNYSGEDSLSIFSQMIGLTVQNFLSAAVGVSILFALIRGLCNKKKKNIGNFWRDLTRIVLYLFIPMSIIISTFLVGSGVVQSLNGDISIKTLNGDSQNIILGPVASQVAIKQLGTNGGGYFGTNSAYPLENPTAFSNFIQMVSILVIPVSLVFMFGYVVKDRRQGYSIFIAMCVFLLLSLVLVIGLEGRNIYTMEGKESRFGLVNSSIWSVATTVTSNGSVNSSLDSYSPLSSGVLLLNMGLGELVFGGVGSGMYTMIGFVLLSVFIAGLMIGRTPEYLGKKIEPYDMKMVLLITLTTPFCVLIFSSISMLFGNVTSGISNEGAHGFTEVLYTFISAGANNGSNFAGFFANTPFLNLILGIVMCIARFVPIYGVLRLAENVSKKNIVATSVGTLETYKPVFIIMLIVIIMVIGALSFFPSIALGPIADFLK